MRRIRILRPPRHRFLARKPCLRFRLRWEGWYSVPRAAKRTWSWKREFIVWGGVYTLLVRRENIGETWIFIWEFKTNSRFVALNIGRGGGRRTVLSSVSGIRGISQKKKERATGRDTSHVTQITPPSRCLNDPYVRRFSHGVLVHQPLLTRCRVTNNLCQQLLPTTSTVLNGPPGRFSSWIYCLVSSSSNLYLEEAGSAVHTLLFFYGYIFLAKQNLHFLLLIKFYLNTDLNERFDVSWPCWCDLRISNFKLQVPANSSAKQQRVLIISKKSFTFKMS